MLKGDKCSPIRNYSFFFQEICAYMLKINCVFSKSLLLIIMDGRIRRMQINKKAVFFTMPFWRLKSASNRCDS